MHDNSGEDGQQMAKLNLTNISNKSVRLEISSTHFINPTSSMTHEKKKLFGQYKHVNIYIYISNEKNKC
jgi:hypothetical protein